MHRVQLPAGGSWKGPSLALAVAAVALLLVYLPDVGHGFIRDDFMWIRIGRVMAPADVARLFTENVGFYRPVVLATFSLNYALSGLAPLPYGLTNLALLLACAALLVRLATSLGLGAGAAAGAAALWVFNFHAVNMALLWLSGRTALLLCLFGLLMMLAMIHGRRWLAAGWCLLALLSKEEAVLFPFAMAAWTWYGAPGGARGRRWPAVVAATWPLCLALAVYLPLRQHAGAFGPATAPSYYRFTTSAPLLLRNIAEYADRACTLSAAIVIIVMAIARRVPVLSAPQRRVVVLGLLWLVAGFAITVLLPVRSDLYALNPSVGAVLAAAAMIESVYARASARSRRAIVALLVLPFVLLPVYRRRDVRWVAPADLSRQAVADLQRLAAPLPDGAHIVLLDDPRERVNLSNAFGSLLPDAVTVAIGRGITAELVTDTAPPGTALAQTVVYRLRNGHLAP